MALAATAQEWVSGGLRYRVVDDDEVAVAPWVEAGTSRYADVVIVPETVFYDGQNYRITTVADSAFYNSAVTEIQLPNSVTHIGRWAMADAFDLVSVTLPLHLEQVSCGMLAGTALTSIIIPEGVTRIDDSAFEDCNLLHTVFLPSTLTEVGDYAFDGCHSLFEIYSTASLPPVWMGDDAMPSVRGVDLVLADDRALKAWRDDELWGQTERFSLWVSDNVVPSFELSCEPWGDHWNSVELGRNLAYRIYGEDGYMMAMTTADHYYLPVGDHEAEYVIVPTDGVNDSEEIMPADLIIMAIGQKVDFTPLAEDLAITAGHETNISHVWTAGDAWTGPKTIGAAVQDGRAAAKEIIAAFEKEDESHA